LTAMMRALQLRHPNADDLSCQVVNKCRLPVQRMSEKSTLTLLSGREVQ
jgi:hypothetical protein